MRHLIFGATGNIGSRVTERLIARGERPSVFVRDEKKAKAMFGDRVDLQVGDLDAPGSSLMTALTGIDEVFLVTDGPELDAQDRAIARQITDRARARYPGDHPGSAVRRY